MGQLITVTVRPGVVAVGAHLRPQPLAHRHGDRAVPVGRRREGRRRPAARRARPAACSTSGADAVTVYSSAVTVEPRRRAVGRARAEGRRDDRAPLRLLRRRRRLVARLAARHRRRAAPDPRAHRARRPRRSSARARGELRHRYDRGIGDLHVPALPCGPRRVPGLTTRTYVRYGQGWPWRQPPARCPASPA